MDNHSLKARLLVSTQAHERAKFPSLAILAGVVSLHVCLCAYVRTHLNGSSKVHGHRVDELQLSESRPKFKGEQFYSAGSTMFLNVRHKEIDWDAREPKPSLWHWGQRIPHRLIVHFAHHKTGTAWFSRVFQLYAMRSGKLFAQGDPDVCMESGTGICQVNNAAPRSALFLEARKIGDIQILMSVRDPRDVAVSGYFYHKTSKESWLHEPRSELGGKSFQQMLNVSSKAVGINMEIDLMTGDLWDNGMRGPYASVLEEFIQMNSTEFALVKYEDMWAAEQYQLGQAWASIGYWFGLTDPWQNKIFSLCGIKAGQEAAAYKSKVRNSLDAEDTGKDHFRRGTPGDWKRHMKRSNMNYAKDKLGKLLIDLGYEKSGDW